MRHSLIGDTLMTAPTHIVLGFDIRADPEAYVSQHWSQARRETYLLKPDTGWPLSVDSAVWPSRFHFSSRMSSDQVPAIERVPEDDRQLLLRLWRSVEAMEHAYRMGGVCGNGDVRIAVGILGSTTNHPCESVNDADVVVPATPAWLALGYDVADGDMTSAISNISYEDRHRTRLSKWSGDLNEFGLFTKSIDAMDFARNSNDRVPIHAPFYVYLLWRMA